MREINRVKDALEWAAKALNFIEDEPDDDAVKLGYARAALTIIFGKLTKEIEKQSEPGQQDPELAALDETLKIR